MVELQLSEIVEKFQLVLTPVNGSIVPTHHDTASSRILTRCARQQMFMVYMAAPVTTVLLPSR